MGERNKPAFYHPDSSETGTLYLQAAHQWWVDRGEPATTAWRFTVDPHGQRIDLLPIDQV